MKYIKLFFGFLLCVLAFGTFSACGQGDNQLQTPKNLKLIDEVLTWDEVEGAEKYLVNFDGEDYITETNSFDIFELAIETKTYHMSVMALGNSEKTFNSEFSKEFEYDSKIAEGLKFSPTEVGVSDSGLAYFVSIKNVGVEGKVVIPSEYNGCPVTRMSDLFSGLPGITGVVLPDSLVSNWNGKELIGPSFGDCTGLKRIKLSASFTEIHNEMFWNCTSLTSIQIPDNVQKIGKAAFWGCTSLTDVKFSEGLQEIGELAFWDCTSLTNVQLPENLREIRSSAFDNTGISEVILPTGITEISGYSFAGAGQLQKLAVAEENPVFRSEENCIIRRADNELVAGCRSSVIPDTVKSIGSSAFHACTGLTRIEIPNSVTSIGKQAFYSCAGLTRIEIPESVREIGWNAFGGCIGLTEVLLPDNLMEIGRNAFAHCTALTQIKIPGVERLFDCFKNCSNLTAVTLSSEIKQIDSLFSFSGCVNLTSITMDGEGDFYAVEGNCIISKVDNVLVAGCKKSVIPDYNIERIADNAFQGCESLGDITIPYGVKSIGNDAFEGCLGLTSVKIPDSVTSIGIEAFARCFDLTSVVIPASVEKIGSCAFEYSGTLYVPFETAPAGWVRRWAKKDFKWYYDGVVFGCKLAYENHYPYVESFTFDASAEIATFSSDLVAPNRIGYTFLGWATEPGGEVKFDVENGRIHYNQMNYSESLPGVGGYDGYLINGVLYEQYDKAARITLPLSVRKTITSGTTLYAVYEKIE